MSIRSGFFNAIKNESDGTYDKVYYASEFASYFASFIGNGIFGKQLEEFKVVAKSNPDMGVIVSPGRAWINGYWIESTEEVELLIDVNISSSTRIDYVVLGLDLITREISIYIKNGDSTGRNAGIVRDENTYELCIARITVYPTTVNIQQSNIIDQRQNDEMCGYAELLINHDITELTTFINEYVDRANADYLVWLNILQNLVDQLEGLISEDAVGALQVQINKLTDNKLDKVQSSEELPEGFVYQQEGGATKLIPEKEVSEINRITIRLDYVGVNVGDSLDTNYFPDTGYYWFNKTITANELKKFGIDNIEEYVIDDAYSVLWLAALNPSDGTVLSTNKSLSSIKSPEVYLCDHIDGMNHILPRAEIDYSYPGIELMLRLYNPSGLKYKKLVKYSVFVVLKKIPE